MQESPQIQQAQPKESKQIQAQPKVPVLKQTVADGPRGKGPIVNVEKPVAPSPVAPNVTWDGAQPTEMPAPTAPAPKTQKKREKKKKEKQVGLSKVTKPTSDNHPPPRAVSVTPVTTPSATKITSITNPEVTFSTHIDSLMREIQSKQTSMSPPRSSNEAPESAPTAPAAQVVSSLPPRNFHPQMHLPNHLQNHPTQNTFGDHQNSPFGHSYGANMFPPPQPAPPAAAAVVPIGVDKLLTEPEASTSTAEDKKAAKSKKRYQCEIEGCNKSFFQKTHLEIHTRAHTGHKPFVSLLQGVVQIKY